MVEARGITMLHHRAFSLLTLPAVVLFACVEVDQPLGDAPSAGQGGSAGTSAGAGGTTGGTEPGGGSGGSAVTGGTGGKASQAGRGGSGNGPGEAGPPSVGGSGGTAGGGGTTSTDCYSPERPDGALSGALGCACGAADEDQCIRVLEGARQHLLAFTCLDGTWASVEDGACDFMWACLIEDRVYEVDGEQGFASPFDECNSCGCSTGGLSCTEIGCGERTCPEGTTLGQACLQCGSPGGCALMEYGCVQTCDDARDCPYGSCYDGLCSVGPCI
jgi:hypothetical protein